MENDGLAISKEWSYFSAPILMIFLANSFLNKNVKANMADNSKIKSPEERAPAQTMFETIVERVHRHLRDIRSKITAMMLEIRGLELETNPETYYGELLNR
jgi:hypothetical protein